MKIYVASKVKHAPMWVAVRQYLLPKGHEIVSTWIDEAGEGQTTSYTELARRCIDEISACDVLILFCEPGDLLKGALIEVGAALALGKKVAVVGDCESLSRVFKAHDLWSEHDSILDILLSL